MWKHRSFNAMTAYTMNSIHCYFFFFILLSFHSTSAALLSCKHNFDLFAAMLVVMQASKRRMTREHRKHKFSLLSHDNDDGFPIAIKLAAWLICFGVCFFVVIVETEPFAPVDDLFLSLFLFHLAWVQSYDVCVRHFVPILVLCNAACFGKTRVKYI